VRLPKRIAAVGTAGLIVGAFAGATAAPAAQNYAPQCEATAKLTLVGLKVGYNIQCTDFNDVQTVNTAGDDNQGEWTAKSYNEGAYVLYSNKWYRAALDATSADEPTKPLKDDENNDVNIWIEQTSATAVAWSATSTAATVTAGSFPSGFVVTKANSSGVTHYYKSNAATVAADVPGTSSKWDDLGGYAAAWAAGAYATNAIVSKDDKFWKAGAAAVAGDVPGVASVWNDLGEIGSQTKPLPYTGPQAGGSKSQTVKYPALVSGYSVIALNADVDGFETEPAVLNSTKTAPAPNQTQYCNGDHPGVGVSCSLQSGVNVYGVKDSDSTYTKLTGATLAVRSGSAAPYTYTDLKSTSFFGDNSLTGSPTTTSASTDFVAFGALGAPTNSGKRIMPATSGSNITGELEIADSPCEWGGEGVNLVALVADPEGQMNTPITFSIPMSKYFRSVKVNGQRVTQEIPAGCYFNYSSTSTVVYSYGPGFTVVPLARPARGAATRVLAVQ